jgi:ribosomal protein S1
MVGLLKKQYIPANVTVNAGEKIQVKIIDYDKDNMKINVVHKDSQYNKNPVKKQSEKVVNNKLTFGDLYKTTE